EGGEEATRITNSCFSPTLSPLPSNPTGLCFFPKIQERLAGTVWQRMTFDWLCYPLFGLYFSALSAFNLGWHELNVGAWISRLQPREYTLRATGWVKTISGIQSLVSVYLLALWALTYFGDPFE